MEYYSEPQANEHPPVVSLDISSGEFNEKLFISQWCDSIGTESKMKFYR